MVLETKELTQTFGGVSALSTVSFNVGQGQIVLGCERDAESAPLVLFSVKA